MTPPRTARPGSAGALPPVTVARFKEATLLIERLVEEKTDVFLDAMTSYRDQHRRASERPLDHEEAAQVAAALADHLGDDGTLGPKIADIQQSGLRAYDQPDPKEFLLAAGVRTAPAFLDAVLRVTALLELDPETFEAAREAETLDDAIAEHVKTLEALDMADARPRAAAAMTHFAERVGGVSPGEAWSLLAKTVWQAINDAVTQLAPRLQGSTSSQLTGSLEPTDGPDGPSSTS